MILCMTGTGPYSFERVTEKLDDLAEKNNWDVFMQLGHSDFMPKHCDFEGLMSRDRLQSLIEKSEVVVCHGGFGSIRDALVLKKPVIAVPRIAELNEVQDNHQEIMVQELEKDGFIMAVYDVVNLESAIKNANSFVPKKLEQSKIPMLIQEFMYS